MSNAVATIERQPKSVLVDMSTRYGMEPAAFEATVRATCMRPDKNGKVPSREEFAAFLLVAKEYSLNPLTREIYAFTAKGGGIVPIVSIDGWINLINSHPACDGFEFDFDHAEDGKLISCTCKMFRKDRSRPVVVTEWLAECIRSTEPWNMKHRMLRHKSLIQAARYAFGFAGIYDEDEGRKIADNRSKEIHGEFTEVDDGGGPPDPSKALAAPAPAGATHEQTTGITGHAADDGGGPPAPGEAQPAAATDDGLEIPDYLRRTEATVETAISTNEQKWLTELDAAFADCRDAGTLFEQNDELMQPKDGHVSTEAWNEACDILERHIQRVQESG